MLEYVCVLRLRSLKELNNIGHTYEPKQWQERFKMGVATPGHLFWEPLRAQIVFVQLFMANTIIVF